MVPVAPSQQPRMSHRAKALARLADPTLPRKVHRENNAVTDSFLQSKRDKHLICKSAFRSQVAERRAALLASRGGVTKPKRRRPSKKLVTTLASLADALPELDEGSHQQGNDDNDNDNDKQKAERRRRATSLRSRPGALKRKEKLVRAETARFGLNLAQLAATKEEAKPQEAMHVEAEDAAAAATGTAETTQAPARASTANRWALLRSFISTTMEQSPAFANKS